MRLTVSVAVLCLSGLGVCAAGNADAVMSRQETNIPAQSLVSALNRLAKERDLAVVYRTDVVGKLRTRGAAGELTVDEVFRELLSGTGLTYHYLDERTVTIGATGPLSLEQERMPPEAGEDAGRSFWERFRMAQVDQGAPTSSSSVGRLGESSDDNSPKLEEVIVTAQKREERLIDVPISIVALSGDELQNRKLTSLDDLQFAVPGMGITDDGAAKIIELRGVSNALGAASLVGVYIDEADVTNGALAQINPSTYDLERVEVLRGPQGTLYGEGSAGGTIRFITKSPVLDRFGMTASVASLFTQGGSPGERINTAINVPVIDHELGIRIAGTFSREGGWIDQPAAGLKDINGQDLTNVRLKALWKPSTQFSASFMAELYRNERSTSNYEDVDGNFTQVFNLTRTPKVNEDHDIYNLTLTYDFPLVKILSTTSYLRERVDTKNVGYSYPPSPPETQPYDTFTPYASSNDHAWIEELRLSSSGSGPWQWTVGGFYRHYRSLYDTPVIYAGSLGPPDTGLPAPLGGSLVDTLFESWSVFGDINYKWRQRFTLGFGLRSFHERQDYVQVYDFGSGPTRIDQTGNFHSVDPRVYAQYQLSRDINIYASVAKGFRSGGFNATPTQPTFAPEDVRTYELGTKMSLLEGRLRAETAIFYTAYKDYVVSGYMTLSDPFITSVNAGSARIKGVEGDFVWRAADQWSLGINGDYYDTRFTKIDVTSAAYAVGDPIDYVPKYQVTSSVERDVAWDGKQVSMRLDYTRRGRMTSRDRNLGPEYYAETDVTNLLGYYMNLRWSQSLSFNLFAQNLLNDRGLIVPVNSMGTGVRSRPRTYGAGFDVAF